MAKEQRQDGYYWVKGTERYNGGNWAICYYCVSSHKPYWIGFGDDNNFYEDEGLIDIVGPRIEPPKEEPEPSSSIDKVQSCNRHEDCDEAEKRYRELNKPAYDLLPANFHCHNDECPDCFGDG